MPAVALVVFTLGYGLLTWGRTTPGETRPTEAAPGEHAGEGPRPQFTPDALFARSSPAVGRVVTLDRRGLPAGTGSAFLVSGYGLFVTNYHVIEQAHSAYIVLADKRRMAVYGVAALDEEADLAVISVEGSGSLRNPPVFAALTKLVPLELAGGDLPTVGSKVYAIGNPLGLANTLSDGLVSGHRELDHMTVIQTTAPISPGSSGGPLLGADGRVVGVTTFMFKGGQNLNFAVPASKLTSLIASCRAVQSLPIPTSRTARRGESEQERRETDDRLSRNAKRVREIADAAESLDTAILPWAISEWHTFTTPYRLGKMPSEEARDSFLEFLVKMELNEKSRVGHIEQMAAQSRMTVRDYCRFNRCPLPQDHKGGAWKTLRDNVMALEFR
jgi:S1-C subfamily serine protease